MKFPQKELSCERSLGRSRAVRASASGVASGPATDPIALHGSNRAPGGLQNLVHSASEGRLTSERTQRLSMQANLDGLGPQMAWQVALETPPGPASTHWLLTQRKSPGVGSGLRLGGPTGWHGD